MNIPAVASAVALFCYLTLAFVVFRRGMRTSANRLFLIYLLTMAVWQAAAIVVSMTTSIEVALNWYKILTALGSVHFIVFFLFVRVFLRMQSQKWLVYTAYAGIVIVPLLMLVSGRLAIGDIYQDDRTGLLVPTFGLLIVPVGLFAYSFLFLANVYLYRAYRQSSSDIESNRLKYMLLGAVIIMVGTVANFVESLRAYPVDVIANIVAAVLTAYVILRYQLLDINFVLRKGLLYFIPTVVVGAVFFLVLIISVQLLQTRSGYELLLVSVFVAVLVALVVSPLQGELQSWVDRRFFRERYNAGQMLQRLSSTAASVLDLDLLTDMILDDVTSTMNVSRAAFVLREEDGIGYTMTAQRGLAPDIKSRLRNDHPIVDWLQRHDRALSKHDMEMMPQFKALWTQEREDLDRLGSELLVPLKTEGNLVGIFALGPKPSEKPYSYDDQRTLITLANQTAVAIANARLYRAVQRELSERERAERQLQKQLRQTLLMNRIIAAASSTLDPATVLRTACDEMAQVLNLPHGVCALMEDDGSCLTIVAEYLTPGFISRLGMTIPINRDSSVFEWIFTQAQPLVIADVLADSRLRAYQPLFKEMGAVTLLLTPLILRDRVVGIMGFDANKPRQFEAEEIDLARNVAAAVSPVLENAQLYAAVQHELAERTRAEAQILASLKEKEVLLKEVHHRVKNNLQVISSLLNLQTRYARDAQTIEHLQDSQNRIRTMALIHEKLYQSENMAEVDFADYLRSLTTYLLRSYGAEERGVKLTLRAVELRLGIDVAVPCGLITSELLSNALKHAFPPGVAGEIGIEVSVADAQRLQLAVCDNGVGFPEGRSITSPGSLGLQLVNTLVQQIGGRIDLERNHGTRFVITFPYQ